MCQISEYISRASQAFGRLHTRVWHERGISIKTKLRVYRAVVLPSLLYGCETWTCYRRHIKKLDQFHLRCLRKVLRVSWKDHVPNQEILRRAELTGIEAMLNLAQLVTGQDMSVAWTTADSQNNCSMLSSQLENGTKAGRGSGTKMCWNRPSRPTTSQLTSGKPWPRTGRPGGQLYARAQSTLREADHRAWMIRDRPGRTECQTLALLYLVSSATRSALPLSGSKLICANTSTDVSSSKSKDYYYTILLLRIQTEYIFIHIPGSVSCTIAISFVKQQKYLKPRDKTVSNKHHIIIKYSYVVCRKVYT